MRARLLTVGIADEGHDNPDGSSRQGELCRCIAGEPVSLVREPGNPHDRHAVRVDTVRGVTIGYLKRDDRWISELIDEGVPVRGIVNGITGGTTRKPSRGCVLRLRIGGKNPDLPISRDVSRRWEEAGWTSEAVPARSTQRATGLQATPTGLGAGLGALFARLGKTLFR